MQKNISVLEVRLKFISRLSIIILYEVTTTRVSVDAVEITFGTTRFRRGTSAVFF